MNKLFAAVLAVALIGGCGYTKKQIRTLVDEAVGSRPLVVHTKDNIKAHKAFEDKIKRETKMVIRSHAQNDPHCRCNGGK